MKFKPSSGTFHRRDAQVEVVADSEDENKGKHWDNLAQNLFYFIGYTVNINSMATFFLEDGITNPDIVPSLFQVLIVCLVGAGPLAFVQVFVGQYTSSGCIALGTMIPAMYGFGYSMLAVAVMKSVQTLFYSGGCLYYILASVLNYPYPPWTLCSKDFLEMEPNCFSRHDIDLCLGCETGATEPCFQLGTKVFSAKLFQHHVAFLSMPRVNDSMYNQVPQARPSAHVFINIMFVYLISSRQLKSLDGSLKICLIFCFLATSMFSILIFSNRGFFMTFREFSYFNLISLTSLKSWMAAFRRVTEGLRISHGGLVLIGSYLTPDTASHFRVCYLIGYFTVFVCIYHVQIFIINSLFSCRINMSEYGLVSSYDISFILYPMELGLSATPQLWCTLHFLVYWMLSIIAMVLEIAFIDEAISAEFGIAEYYRFTRFFISALVFALCLPLTGQGGLDVLENVAHDLRIINLFIICVLFVILLQYSLQRFDDDIHFLLGVPPTWYIQTCWVVTALFSMFTLGYQIWHYNMSDVLNLAHLPIYIIVSLPILVGFVIRFVQYMRERNVTGVFRPSIFYGPPDTNVRMLRLLYNPRVEVRYRRRRETCKHRCLLNNTAVADAIDRELNLLVEIGRDLRESEEFGIEYEDIVTQIEEHHRVMRKRFDRLKEQLEGSGKSSSV